MNVQFEVKMILSGMNCDGNQSLKYLEKFVFYLTLIVFQKVLLSYGETPG